MSQKNINFFDKKIKKSSFYKSKKIFNNIDDIDVNKILISKRELYGKKAHLFALLDTVIMMQSNNYV